MPRLKPDEVAAALGKPPRSPAQLANDARLRAKPKASISTEDLSGARSEIGISVSGDAEATHRQIEVESDMKVAETEGFMNGYVTVNVQMADDPNAAMFIHSGHNGIDQYIQRGVNQKIKLKFLYSLLAAKRTQYACSFGKDNSGNEFNRLDGRANTTHKIDIIDATPKMREAIVGWLQQPA
jgi:hypothetical protein